ncbi:hypothetical protein ACRAWF_42875 [Streptomyces sp. L7]
MPWGLTVTVMSAGEAAMKAAAAAPTNTPADVDRYLDRDLAGRLDRTGLP